MKTHDTLHIDDILKVPQGPTANDSEPVDTTATPGDTAGGVITHDTGTPDAESETPSPKRRGGRRKAEPADAIPPEPGAVKQKSRSPRKAKATNQVPSSDGAGDYPVTSTLEPPDPQVGSLQDVLGFGGPPAVSGAIILTPIRMKVGDRVFLRCFTDAMFSAKMHWAERPDRQDRADVVCLGEGCPLCAAGNRVKVKYGVPVVYLDESRLALLTFTATPGKMEVPLNSVPEALRTAMAHGLDKVVLSLHRAGMFEYRHHVHTVPPPADADSRTAINYGNDLIRDYKEAADKGLVSVQLGLRLTRQQILERFPEVGQAAALQGVFGNNVPADQTEALARLFGKAGDDVPVPDDKEDNEP